MEKRLYLYNTLTGRKDLFDTPHDKVGMYCCGPTVYNFAHIGNLRTYIFEDILKRALLSCGFKVNHVVNITDVGHLTSDADSGEDKMEKGAKREGKSVWDIARHYTDKFMENLQDLNISSADEWPKATDHIPEMIKLIQELEKNDITYKTDDGIYFDTSKFPAYCDFAHLDPQMLRAGSRVAMGDKKNPTDFALWKFSPKDEKRQMEWESPWGTGFPGWHIECSAMSLKYLPQPIDIHCGGSDHIRIHHTNEIAQVEAANHTQYVRFWLHGEWLIVDKGKMSKSKGNFTTLDSLKAEKISPLSYRLYCFTAHYRTPLRFSWEGVHGAASSLQNLKKLAAEQTLQAQGDCDLVRVTAMLEPFWSAVYDDLNMPQAIAAVWDLLHDTKYSAVEKKKAIQQADTILGLDLLKQSQSIVTDQGSKNEPQVRVITTQKLDDTMVNKIIELAIARKRARQNKDFAQADQVRSVLTAMGVSIKDLSDGTSECYVQ